MERSAHLSAGVDPRGWQDDLSWATDRLAVSGHEPAAWPALLSRQQAIAAVIDLRAEACDDALAHREAGIAFLHLPTPDLHPVTQDMLDRGVDFARRHLAAGRRVLIHCHHGIGRAPLLALCVLAADGMAPLEALSLLKARRWKVSPSPEQYRGWSEWLERNGLAAPDFGRFCEIAYAHLATA